MNIATTLICWNIVFTRLVERLSDVICKIFILNEQKMFEGVRFYIFFKQYNVS